MPPTPLKLQAATHRLVHGGGGDDTHDLHRGRHSHRLRHLHLLHGRLLHRAVAVAGSGMLQRRGGGEHAGAGRAAGNGSSACSEHEDELCTFIAFVHLWSMPAKRLWCPRGSRARRAQEGGSGGSGTSAAVQRCPHKPLQGACLLRRSHRWSSLSLECPHALLTARTRAKGARVAGPLPGGALG